MAYEETDKELKGKLKDKHFIITKEKNLFLCPADKAVKGSVINFLAHYRDIGLKQAAEELYNFFLKAPSEPKRDIPELTLHYDPLVRKLGINEELAKQFEVGMVKERSIMAGKLAFLLRDAEGNRVGYIGYNKDGSWFFPKGHKQEHLYNLHRIEGDTIILTANPFEVIDFSKQGTPAIALMSSNMTEAQEELLKRFDRILIKLANSDNIRNRLSQHCYVKVDQP